MQKKGKHIRFLPHVLFVSALFFLVSPHQAADSLPAFLFHKSISLILQLVPLFINLYVLVPYFYYGKKWLYAGMLVNLLVLFTFLNYQRFQWTDAAYIPSYIQLGHPINSLLFVFISMVIVHAIAFLFMRADLRQKQNQQIHDLEKSRLESELQFLKLQISPHFYFNILNSIYHSIKINPVQAENITIQLSEIMQYHIYECSKDKVELDKEIKNIHNYIGLQKMRLASQPRINVEINGDTSNKFIAPLILITFVENSFKHGLEKQRHSSFLDIQLLIRENTLQFKIVNSKPPAIKHSPLNGNGLSNVKTRLNLTYPSRHSLTVEESADQYSVLLDLSMN